MWILKTNIAVGSYLVYLALEEVSVEFHSTIFTLGIMSKLFCTRLIKWFYVAVRDGMAAKSGVINCVTSSSSIN